MGQKWQFIIIFNDLAHFFGETVEHLQQITDCLFPDDRISSVMQFKSSITFLYRCFTLFVTKESDLKPAQKKAALIFGNLKKVGFIKYRG